VRCFASLSTNPGGSRTSLDFKAVASSLLPLAVSGDAAPSDVVSPALPENVTPPIDRTGSVFLSRDATGNLFAGMTPITHGQEPLNQAVLAGAVAIAAESLPSGNRLLLQTAAAGIVSGSSVPPTSRWR
jgi:hypothetical protein